MSPSIVGVIIGLLIAILTIGPGQGALGIIVGIAFAAIGFAVAGHVAGQFDLREILKGQSRD